MRSLQLAFFITLGLISFTPKSTISHDNNMVLIPAGKFIMGNNDQGLHEHFVYLDSYQIDKREVTIKSYSECVTAGKCSSVENNKHYPTNGPMRNVSWFEASNYCKWVGKRLPTEAEWEKAARGPKGYVNPWGNRELKDTDIKSGYEFADELDKSGYGVYDMAGKVSEWVADWYSDEYYEQSPTKNPTGPLKGTKKVVRGSNWRDIMNNPLSTSFFSVMRWGVEPNAGVDFIGFRCAR